MRKMLVDMQIGLAVTSMVLLTGCGDGSTPSGRRLILLHTNDEHSQLFGFAPEVDDFPAPTSAGDGTLKGGVARRKALLDRERAAARQAGADTLTVSGGDVMMGTLAHVAFDTTSPDYALMGDLGYDAACIGNHEFDFGPGGLARSISAAQKGGMPQLVASNLHFSAEADGDDALAALYGEGTSSAAIKRYHVTTTPNGLKIGFLGVLGARAAYLAPLKTPARGSGLPEEESDGAKVMPKIYADLQPVVDALRSAEKVDLVVALSHSGVDLERPEIGEDYRIAENVAGIDVIVSGHTHTAVEQPIVVKNKATGADVIIVQAGSQGDHVGRLALAVDELGAVTWDKESSKLLAVDDRIVPDAEVSKSVVAMIAGIEAGGGSGGSSFLEQTLSRALGVSIKDDPMTAGDLYFYPLGKVDYDLDGSRPFVETPLLDLAADAMLDVAIKEHPMKAPDLAVIASGVVRADLRAGAKGDLTFAEVFRALSLGSSPVDGSIGYPMARAWLLLAEVKAAIEVGVSVGFIDSAFFLGFSGIRATVDTSRPAFDAANPLDPNNGRVTRIEWDSTRTAGADTYDTVLFDVDRGDPWSTPDGKYNVLSLLQVVTDVYIASFAESNGVTLKDENGNAIEFTDTILHRAGGSEIKDFEALATYLKKLTDGNGGKLPSRYDPADPKGKVPRRLLCSGPLCGRY